MSSLKVIVVFFFTLLAFEANAGTYSFGGGCASMGAWTQTALGQTDTLIRITQSLRDNPACKGIETIVPKLQEAQAALKLTEDEAQSADRLESIPNEIAALRNFAVSSPDLKTEVMKLLTHRTLEGATLTAEAATAATSTTGAGVAAAVGGPAAPAVAMAAALRSVSNRVRRASVVGLDMLDQAFTILPNYQECIMGAPDQGLALIGAMVKLSAAYASSQEAVAARMGRTISGLVTFLRNSKFSSVLRQLNETEFWMSMSCLMETTSQSYCSTRDARKLLDYGIRELRVGATEEGKVDMKNPLEGYYVLTRDIPKIAEWLQKIQFGIVPKLSTDAVFKNLVLDNVNELQKNINIIRGLYKETMLTYAILPDLESKRNTLLSLVETMDGRLSEGRGGGVNPQNMNFFVMSMSSELIPFFLIGKTELPDECRPRNLESGIVTPGMSFHDWVYNGGKFINEFADPDALARTVELQLEKLIELALTKASLYYQQRMIVDAANLVNDSVTSQAYTVVESLARVYEYLGGLLTRIGTENGDVRLIPSIRETMKRINTVLLSYEEVKRVATAFPPAGSTDEDEKKYDETVSNAYKKVIETAYDQFNVLLQRDTFLSTRLSTLIHYDYALRIKSKEDMSPYEKDLLIETGKELLARLLNVVGANPTAALSDLNSAMVVNKRNLEAVELLFKDKLYPVIEEIGLIAQGRATDRNLNMRSLYRMYRDAYFSGKPPSERGWIENSLGYYWAFATGGAVPWVRRFWHADLYPFHVSLDPTIRGADDEFQSFEQFKSRLCVQTLSFNDRKFYQDVCQGSLVKSAFSKENNPKGSPLRGIPLDIDYNEFMTGDKATAPVTSDSICAFQNFSRRNLVYWMTLDLPESSNH